MPNTTAEKKEYSYELKIPQERIAVLIGKDGETKKELEHLTSTKINIDSEEGDITFIGTDPLKLFSAREILLAIARGFNPDIAKLLLKVDYALELVNVTEYARTKKDMLRIKGRVIGHEGKSRRVLEELTECYISVYGKTVGVIGQVESVSLARTAVERLLQGAPHGNVFKWLEKQRGNIKEKKLSKDFE